MPTQEVNMNEARQRLLEIDVQEVSLVDRPANEEQFLVIKRDGGGKEAMSDKKDEVKQTPQAGVIPPGGDPPTTQPVTKQAPTHEAILAEKLAAIAKLAGDVSSGAMTMEPDMLEEKLEALQQLSWGVRKPLTVINALAKGLNTIIPNAEVGKDDGAKLVEGLRKSADDLAAKAGATVPAKKSITVEFHDDGGLEVLDSAETVLKGKQFTDARKGAFKEGLMALLKLIKELDPAMADELAKACGAAGSQENKSVVGGEPALPSPQAGQEPVKGMTPEEQGQMKASWESALSKNKELEGQLVELTKRLDTLEKARLPGNAAPTDGTAVQKSTDGGRDGMFHDVLFG